MNVIHNYVKKIVAQIKTGKIELMLWVLDLSLQFIKHFLTFLT